MGKMIFFAVTQLHRYTLRSWIDDHSEQLKDRVRIVSYHDVSGLVQPGTYVFSDLERLDNRWTTHAQKVHDALRRAGLRTLNHPRESLRRYDLLKTLSNDFNVYRSDEDLNGVRFPVFLRHENDHTGPLTRRIYSLSDLKRALKATPEALVVEYLDASDSRNVHRKYSCFRVGQHIIPAHLFISSSWMMKIDEDALFEPERIREEADFVKNNPHARQVATIFEKARIEYGRMDYTIHNGRINVFEINTNPNVDSWYRTRPHERQETIRRRDEMLIEAILELADCSRENKIRVSRLSQWNKLEWNHPAGGTLCVGLWSLLNYYLKYPTLIPLSPYSLIKAFVPVQVKIKIKRLFGIQESESLKEVVLPKLGLAKRVPKDTKE